jgi:transposase
LLPGQYVKPYRRRNKTDRGDARAILEAARCADLPTVSVKTIEQQTVLALYRVREQLKATRTARINAVRGHLREFGILLPPSAQRFLAEVGRALDTPALPAVLKPILVELLEEIRALAKRMKALE